MNETANLNYKQELSLLKVACINGILYKTGTAPDELNTDWTWRSYTSFYLLFFPTFSTCVFRVTDTSRLQLMPQFHCSRQSLVSCTRKRCFRSKHFSLFLLGNGLLLNCVAVIIIIIITITLFFHYLFIYIFLWPKKEKQEPNVNVLMFCDARVHILFFCLKYLKKF